MSADLDSGSVEVMGFIRKEEESGVGERPIWRAGWRLRQAGFGPYRLALLEGCGPLCRVAGVDPAKPRKELSQHFEKYNLKTKVIDSDDWGLRCFLAYMFLKYGMDMDDWEFDDWFGGPDEDDDE